MEHTSLSDSLISLIPTYGPWIIFGIVALESAGVPLPGETILVAAALLAATTGQISIVVVVLASAGGAIVGDGIGYMVGRRFGLPLIRRYGRMAAHGAKRTLIQAFADVFLSSVIPRKRVRLFSIAARSSPRVMNTRNDFCPSSAPIRCTGGCMECCTPWITIELAPAEVRTSPLIRRMRSPWRCSSADSHSVKAGQSIRSGSASVNDPTATSWSGTSVAANGPPACRTTICRSFLSNNPTRLKSGSCASCACRSGAIRRAALTISRGSQAADLLFFNYVTSGSVFKRLLGRLERPAREPVDPGLR